jgi:predicted LPLAT superfamily acyltransferase
MSENNKWKGNTGGGTLGQRGLIFFFRWWNLRFGYAIMAVVVPFYMLFSHKSFMSIYLYFRQQFGFSKWTSFFKTYRNHFLFGQIILDRFAVFAGKKQYFELEIIGYEHFQRLANGEKGFIIASSHIGNYELGGYLLYSDKKPINALVFAGETPTMQQNRTKILGENNIHLIPILSDMSHLFTLNTALQNGEIVSMPCDRIHGSAKSVECRFFNGLADFPVGAFNLAATFDVDILAIFCMKITSKKYKIFVQPIGRGEPAYSTATKKEKINDLVLSYVKELEWVVKQYPEQWFNYHKFWK